MNVLLTLVTAMVLWTPVADQPAQLCGVTKPALEDVQGPRLPGQVLYPTWPPAGCNP